MGARVGTRVDALVQDCYKIATRLLQDCYKNVYQDFRRPSAFFTRSRATDFKLPRLLNNDFFLKFNAVCLVLLRVSRQSRSQLLLINEHVPKNKHVRAHKPAEIA